MHASSPRVHRVVVLGLATAAMTVALAPPFAGLAPPSAAAASGSSCVNGVVPLNPYVVNCSLPARGNQIAGAAPDAGAIIACRSQPACLSAYVNYPGTLIVPGYRP